MKIGAYLKKTREALSWSSREASKHSGISHVHILDIEDGKKVPGLEVLSKLIKAYGIEWNEFLKETGYMPPSVEPAKTGKMRGVPLISWVTAGEWTEVCDVFEPGQAEDWVETDVKGKHIFALRVKGDSMEPEFKEGEIIVVNPDMDVNPGDYAVVKNHKGEATMKQLKRYGNTFVLHPLNPKYPDMEVKKGEFQIIGKVVEKKKKY